jgi:transposase
MDKFETAFKLKVVESFLAGDGGAKLLARRWSVPEERVRSWVSHYRAHGMAGLRPKRGSYPGHFKLQVLLHQEREKLSSRQVAVIYDIRNSNQIVVWRRAFDDGGVAALENKRQARPMKAEKSQPEPPGTDSIKSHCALREEVEQLRAEVAYLKKLQALVRQRQAAQKKRRPSASCGQAIR